jgi:hypothetical protein
MTTLFACPCCGSPLKLDTQAEKEVTVFRQASGTMPYLDKVRVTVPVAFCTGCEFALEVKP